MISLEKTGSYSKAIKYAERLLHLIDSRKEDFNIQLNDYTTYWSILLAKGRCLYNLRDYNNSIPVFERLLKFNSENDNYKNWLKASKSRKRNTINKYLYLIAAILLIINIFFDDKFGNPKIKLYVSVIGLISLMIALINEFLVEKILGLMNKE